VRIQSSAFQPSAQPIEARLAERHRAIPDAEFAEGVPANQLVQLPLGGHFGREVVEQHWLDDQAEDSLMQRFCEEEFGDGDKELAGQFNFSEQKS
jgi:hypothetical protein